MKTTFILLISFIVVRSYGQSSDCFSEVRSEMLLSLTINQPLYNNLRKKEYTGIGKDSTFKVDTDSIAQFQKKVLNKLTGCTFPKEFFTTSDGKELNHYALKVHRFGGKKE